MRIRAAVTRPHTRKMAHVVFPGGTYGLRWLKGTVVSSDPAETARTLLVAVSGADTPEAMLRVGRVSPPGVRVRKGAAVEFEGETVDFSPSPFMLTIKVDVCRGGTNNAGLRCELAIGQPPRTP